METNTQTKSLALTGKNERTPLLLNGQVVGFKAYGNFFTNFGDDVPGTFTIKQDELGFHLENWKVECGKYACGCSIKPPYNQSLRANPLATAAKFLKWGKEKCEICTKKYEEECEKEKQLAKAHPLYEALSALWYGRTCRKILHETGLLSLPLTGNCSANVSEVVMVFKGRANSTDYQEMYLQALLDARKARDLLRDAERKVKWFEATEEEIKRERSRRNLVGNPRKIRI